MDLIEKRFNELSIDAETIEQSKTNGSNDNEYIDQEQFIKWKIKLKSLIKSINGTDNEYYQAFIKNENAYMYDTNYDIFIRLKPIFMALKEDYLNGYLESYKTIIQADVFSDQIEQAKELLNANYISAAAIIAGIVLETKIRDTIIINEMELGKLDKMNADLAKKGIYNSLIQKQVTAIAAIRNSAAHGKNDEFNKDQVELMIEQVLQLLTKIS